MFLDSRCFEFLNKTQDKGPPDLCFSELLKILSTDLLSSVPIQLFLIWNLNCFVQGIDIENKIINLDGDLIKLEIWDTVGQERFNSITAGCFRNTMGVVIMYDITEKDTFDNVPYWISNCHEVDFISISMWYRNHAKPVLLFAEHVSRHSKNFSR